MKAMFRSMRMPGVSAGTRNIDICSYGGACGSVTAMTMRNAAFRAFEEKNFCPSMTHPSASRHARVRNSFGSGPAVVALLLVGAGVGQDLGVAGVGRLGPEDDRRPGSPAQDLVEQGQLHLAVTLAAQLGPEVAGPERLVAHLLLERIDDLAHLRRRRLELVRMRKREIERLARPAPQLPRPCHPDP